MHLMFYRLAAWIRDSRRTGYAWPIFVTIGITALLMGLYKLLEQWLFPGISLLKSRIASVVLGSLMTGFMAYIALRLYRQMAQDTIDELTERLRLSEELLEERNLIKSLMENSVDRVYFKDLDGRYIRASASVAQAFGLVGPGAVVGRSDFDFFLEDYAKAVRRDEQEVVRTSRPIVGRAYGERWKDGRETWASVSVAPLCDRHGRVIGVLGIARDITESRAREQRFRQLSRAVEQSPDMVVITDRAGAIEYVNPRFCDITGYSAPEVFGRTPSILRSGHHDRGFFQQLWNAVLSGHEWRGEMLNRKKDGALFWVRSAISPIRNAAGEITHLVSVAEDISREKKAAEVIRQEQERRRELEQIITYSPAIVFLWRAEAGWPVEYVSANISQWGYGVEELTSGARPFGEMVHPADLPRVAEEVRQYTEGRIANFVQEYRIRQKDGAVRWVEDRTWMRHDADGRVTHYQGIVIDTTDRKQAEFAQQALLEGLRTVLALADELIACPSEDALFLRAVELARERLRVERCGIMIQKGESVCGTYGTDLRGATTDEHAHAFPMDDTWRDRFRVRGAKDSRWQIVAEPHHIWDRDHFDRAGEGWIAITPIQSSAHESFGVFCNDTAISKTPSDPITQEVLAVYCSLLGNMVARKRAESEQQSAVSQQREFMERADRLNSLGLLAAGMAHEINNPLQGMLSHVRAVERFLPEEAEARASLSMVERGIESIAGLVRKLLYLGVTEKGMEAAEARECVEFVTQLLASPLRRARIRIECRFPKGRLTMGMPRRELIQVLLNLIINARDAMPDGGVARIEVDSDGEMGRIRIADNGPGIPPEVLDRIFAPFFTTKGTKGTGLGLSVAESMVRSNKGYIRVDSAPGKGATFSIHLPLIQGSTS